MNIKGRITVGPKSFTQINELTPAQKMYGHFLIHHVEIKETADKKTTYLDLTLMDSTGTVSAKWWNVPQTVIHSFGKKQVVYATGLVKTYNNQIQVNIEYMSPTADHDPLQFVPRAPEEAKYLFHELLDFVDRIENEHITKLLRYFISQYQDELRSFPAAVSMHHAVATGLLYHTVSMLRVAERILEVYPWLRSDLLYFGVMMHDLGKIHELDVENGVASCRSVHGQLVGHVVEGALMIERAILHLKLPIEDELKTMLLHMVLSHHEKLEWGSPVTPQLPEAFMLCMIDLMDARCFAMQQSFLKGTGEFSEPIKMIGSQRLYRGSLAKERP